MPLPSESDIELKFGREPDRHGFPAFCNALIAQEAPRAPTFPVLSSKPGPDGGIDGEWDLTGVDGFESTAVARAGWNVYQFKTIDVAAFSSEKAVTELCRRVRGAVPEVIARLQKPQVPSLYVLFTNLSLGLASESSNSAKRRLNTQRTRVENALLEGAPEGVSVEIIDAGQLAGFVARLPTLRLAWFAPGKGSTWQEMQAREQRETRVDVSLFGRDKELAELEGWLADRDVRVITLSGPNSVGKTRLALEATCSLAPITVFAEDAAALLRDGIDTVVRAGREAVIVLEDPPTDIAGRLASQAVGSQHAVKLLITMPSPAHAPVVRLGDERVKESRVAALTGTAPQRLVEAANPGLDNDLRDWIIRQAGGMPGVLVDAALMGSDLRRDAGTLREQITRKYRQRLTEKFGKDAIPVVQALCPLVYVGLGDSSQELRTLLGQVAVEISEVSARRIISELELLGYVRRRGEYVAVVPPLFAAGLLEELLRTNPFLPESLHRKLNAAAHIRLLERLVTVELPESATFWSFVFGDDGPFGDGQHFSSENFELLEYLARAVPVRTAYFLRQHAEAVWLQLPPASNQDAFQLWATINTLLDEPATAIVAFEMLTLFARHEAEASEPTRATMARGFNECFVYWYPRAIPYEQREAAVESLLVSPDLSHQRLGIEAVVTATNPPHSLSGGTVRAQRLRSGPRSGYTPGHQEFLVRMMQRRLALCIGEDPAHRTAALRELPAAISELQRNLPVQDTMVIVRETLCPYFDGKLQIDPVELHHSLLWVRNAYKRSSQESSQTSWLPQWQAVIAELDDLLTRLVGGVFEHRFRIALGHPYDHNEVSFEGRKLHGFQVHLLQLAREACQELSLMTDAAWARMTGIKENYGASQFISFLGENDKTYLHFPAVYARAVDWQGGQFLGLYLRGVASHSSEWVEMILDDLVASSTAPKLAALLSVRAADPTPANRLRLKTLLSGQTVSAREVATAFSGGRWLDDLPHEEVLEVFEFITATPGQERDLLGVGSLYLYGGKPLPRILFPVIERALFASASPHARDAFECDQVAAGLARADLDAGFKLLRKAIQQLSNRSEWDWREFWNPFEFPGTHDFWDYLRAQDPDRAYNHLGEWNPSSHWPDLRGHRDGYLLDLAAHQTILLSIARGSVVAAQVFARCLQPTQPNFFEFVYSLLDVHANAPQMVASLNAALTSHSGFGSEFDHLASVDDLAKAQLKRPELSPATLRWLDALCQIVKMRQEQSHDYFRSTEPPLWD